MEKHTEKMIGGFRLQKGVSRDDRCEVCKVGYSAMSISQTGTYTETLFCIRQLEQEKS